MKGLRAQILARVNIGILVLVSAAARAQDVPDGPLPDPVDCEITYGPVTGPNGHLYEVVLGCVWSWNEARLEAGLRSIDGAPGHLATITSGEEDKFIETVRQDALDSVGIDPFDAASAPQLWVGGFQAPDQEEINQGWSWVNGEGSIPETNFDPGYANWLAGEPNDVLLTEYVEDNEENHLTIGLFGQFGWNDEGADLGGYVVEYEAAVLPEISLRIEPVRLHGDQGRRFEARRVTAVHTSQNDDEEENEPEIFVSGAGQQERFGPYPSGTILVFDLIGRMGPRELGRFVVLPVEELPAIFARDPKGDSSGPVVLDIFLDRGVLPAEVCGPTIRKEALRNLTRIVPGPWSPGLWNTNALAIQSFVFQFLNGDHRVGEFVLQPVQAPEETCWTSHFLYLSDRDYGIFGTEGDEPVRYTVSFCDLQGVADVVSTGSFEARGRRRLSLPRRIRTDEVVVLGGFSFRTLGGNHRIREITVMPDPGTSSVEVFYGDDDGNDRYSVSVDLLVADRARFAGTGSPYRSVLGDSPGHAGPIAIFPVGVPLPVPEEPLLAGFRLRFRGSDQNLGRIGVTLNPYTPTHAGRGRAYLQEDGFDAPFTYEVRWAGYVP